MNSPEATVVSTGVDTAIVSVAGAAACARCAAGRGCGAGLLQQHTPRVLEVRVAGGLILEAGDRVRLSMAPEQLLRAAWLAYGLPLGTLLASVALASSFARSDPTIVASGLAGLFVGVLAGRRFLRQNDCLHRIVPTAIEKTAANGRNAAMNNHETGAGPVGAE